MMTLHAILDNSNDEGEDKKDENPFAANPDLDRTFLADQKNNKPSEEYKGQEWKKIDHSIDFVRHPNQYWVSRGQAENSGREYLYFDTQSERLMALKKQALEKCKDSEVRVALYRINDIINQLTALPGKIRYEVERTIDERFAKYILGKGKEEGLYRATMDELIEQKLLICRHKGPLAASLIAFLIENEILPNGAARQYRSSIPRLKSAHTWATYRNYQDGKLWVVDPRTDLFIDCTNQRDLATLKQKYDSDSVKRMIERSDNEDLYRPLIEKIEACPHYFPFTAQMSEGTEQNPFRHLRLELGQNEKAFKALGQAFLKQHINHKPSLDKTYFVISADNKGIFNLDFDLLKKDYDHFLNELTPTAPVIVPPVTQQVVASPVVPVVEQNDPYSKLLAQFEKLDFLNAHLNEGTKNNPGRHLRLFVDKREQVDALSLALWAQQIKVDVPISQAACFLILRIEKNAHILSLDFARLKEKYHDILNTSKSVLEKSKRAKTVTPIAQAPIQTLEKPIEISPAAPVVPPSASRDTATIKPFTVQYDMSRQKSADNKSQTALKTTGSVPQVSISFTQGQGASQQIAIPAGHGVVIKYP